ncbi:MAG: HAD hydrolase-like protein [Desulfobacterales bacterium]|jgi:phosphoglycolate phosphatase-like HAD superfamily hydrolase|nr:HAD hydrolase-like protein [Desulfobacterales bacterium]
MNLSKVKICIFDVNGVLIDSNMANARAMGRAFSGDPMVQEQIAAFYLTLTGIDRGEKIRRVQSRIIQRPFGENEFEGLWQKLKTLTQRSMGTAPPAKGCKNILDAVARRGMTRVALSNTPLDELRRILAAQGLESHLDIIRGGGNWPKTESLKCLLDEFEFRPGDCLFIGDGKGDLWATRATGVPFAAIDPDTGEFENEHGFFGPFHTLLDWAEQAGLI